MIVRGETIANHEPMRALLLASFPTSEEADLVDALRANGDAQISLVGSMEGKLIGHVMCSPMQAPFKALGLAPVCVHAGFRQQGLAETLIRAAIAQATNTRWDGIFVYGDPKYYRRFGFSVARASKFKSPYAGPYLMALSLQSETLPAQSGIIEYAPAFATLS